MQNCVGKIVAERRRSLGFSQNDIAIAAQKLGWDVDALLISKIEAGRRRVTDREIYWLAKLLACPMDALFPPLPDMRKNFLTANAPRTGKR